MDYGRHLCVGSLVSPRTTRTCFEGVTGTARDYPMASRNTTAQDPDGELDPEFLARLLALAELARRRYRPVAGTQRLRPGEGAAVAAAIVAELAAEYIKLVAEMAGIQSSQHLETLQQQVLGRANRRLDVLLAISAIRWNHVTAARAQN
jgi:hypothetical protein